MSATEEAVAGIDVKTAVQAAREFAKNLLEPEGVQGLGLEAVERTEDGKWWLVTLGFYRPPAPTVPRKRPSAFPSPLEDFLPSQDRELKREYKVFKVDASSGDILGMQLFKD